MLSGDPFPYVQSINLVGPAATDATSLSYEVTFSEAVTGVDPSDFKLAASGVTAALPVVVSGSGANYTVKIGGVAGSGTLGLNLVDNNSIRDLAGNPLVTKNVVASFAPQQSYTTGLGPDTAELSDFNLDGKLDIVTTNAGNSFVNTVSVLLGNGDGTFQNQLVTSNAQRQTAEAVGDVNADGKPDLITTNYTSNTVSVLLGRGDGTFDAPSFLSPGVFPSAVVVGDCNGDGKLDIAVTNEYSNNVSLFVGNGDGSFQPQRTFAVGRDPSGMAIGDINADGLLDLAVTNYMGSSVSVLLGNGDGTFQSQRVIPTDRYPYRISLGDVNLDGRLDIATDNIQYFSDKSNTVSILLGNGDGTFLPQQTFSTIGNPYSVTQGDINGDGKPDLIVAIGEGNGNTVNMFLGNGDGTFQPAQSFTSGGLSPNYASLGDLNLDGRSDVVVANAGSSNVSVFLNTGNGSFTGQVATIYQVFPYVTSINLVGSPQPFATTRDYTVTFSEAVTGVDSSDFQLALSGASASLPVAVSGSGASYTVKISGITGVGTLGLNLVDNNSIRDLAGNPLTTANAVASFAPQVSYETGAGPTSAMLGDFNLDGKLDLVAANNYDSRPGGYDFPNAVSVLLGNGDGTFQDHLASTNAGWQTGEAVGDVNADGKPDLVTANFYDNTVSVLIGKGDGTFQSPLTLSIRSPASVVIADVNADGHPDIAATDFDDGNVGVFLGNGDGTFFPERVIAAGAGAHGLAIGDVNADGALDLVTANYYGSSVSVLLGNDDGTFQSQRMFAADPWTYRVSIGDMNRDGKADIATANSTYSVFQSNSVSILLGNGDGTFQPQQPFAASPVPVSVTQGDLNGDGKPDLVVANTDLSINTISIYLGNGDGTFRTALAYSTGLAPYTPAVGDLNGDGRLDIVVPNSYSDGPPNSYIDNVSVFLNTGNGSFTGQTTTVRVGNVYTVTSVGDSGPGSLRQAILNANTHPGPDTIQFAILGASKAITLSSALPTITGVVAIDGSTQEGVSVVGSRVPSAITGLAFAAAASDSYVGGLTMSGFKGTGIAATGAKVTLQSNTLTGNKTGISLTASPASLIGGLDAAMANMLSGNNVGVALAGACTGTVVDRNMLNGNGIGVSLSNATGVQVGVVGNTIAGSTSYGVQATGSLAGSVVQANAITGTTYYGVYLSNAANLMVMGNTISDGKPQGAGLYAVGTLTNTVVQGNTIRNNRGSGVLMDNARGITIGLTAGGAGVANTIVNNSGFGLRAWGTSTGSGVRKNIISGNNVDVQIAAAKGLTYVPLAVNRVVPISHSLSAPNASVRLLKGPKTGPSAGPISAHQKPSLSGSTWLARVICNLPISRRPSASS